PPRAHYRVGIARQPERHRGDRNRRGRQRARLPDRIREPGLRPVCHDEAAGYRPRARDRQETRRGTRRHHRRREPRRRWCIDPDPVAGQRSGKRSHDRAVAEAHGKTEGKSMSTAHVLVVDDEADIRALIQEILTDENYRVTVAANAAEARASRKEHRFDLVLLDIWMPDTDGISLLREWSEQGDQIGRA